jgi:peroxiredoxin 2/4
VIDDNGIVRAMVYYPLTTGRNMEELLRLIDALTTDKHGVATPANWHPGEKVIVPPPRTVRRGGEDENTLTAPASCGCEPIDSR